MARAVGVRLAAAVVALGASCQRGVAPPQADTLLGLTAPLVRAPEVVFAVDGTVAGRPAEVRFDVSTPLARVTTGCFETPLIGGGRATLAAPFTDAQLTPLTRVAGLTVSGIRLAPFEAALLEAGDCAIWLGRDALGDGALAVDLATRTLTVRPSQPKAQWLAEVAARGQDAQVLELTLEPKRDWPLVAVRVRQGAAELTAPFVVALHERHSLLSDRAAAQAGVKPGADVLTGLALPDGVTVPSALSAIRGFPYEALELAPQVGVGPGALKEASGDAQGAAGVLGADVLGQWAVSVDVRAGVLVLQRPQVFSNGARHRCRRGADEPSEEACFELVRTADADGGVQAALTLWRPLEQGVRVHLELPGAPARCRVGVSFSPGGRGRSAAHHFPWPGLDEQLPECAQALRLASDVRLSLYEEGPLPGCLGICGFVEDLQTGRQSCECQPGPFGEAGDAEWRLFELRRLLLQRAREEREREPQDPP